MKNHPLNFDQLTNFSNSLPYKKFDKPTEEIFSELSKLKVKLNFPAIQNDIGSFLSFLMPLLKPRTIFEMGSGYGHSAFWFLCGGDKFLDKIVLTEKRNDLEGYFNSLPWPDQWRQKIEYHQADAFEVFTQQDQVDLVLIDGVKGDYLDFLIECEVNLRTGSHVVIDNSYWRGSFLEPEVVKHKKSARNIKELHEYIAHSDAWESIFMPYVDGLSLLRKI